MDLKQQDKFCDDLLNYLKNNSYSMIKGFSEYWGKDFSAIFNYEIR